MFKKYKQLVIGFIIGATMFSVMPVKAAIEEFICYRADYKVMVNGSEYTSDDLPILSYKGNTYAPFRSILEKAGMKVTWNAELNQAEVKAPTLTTSSVEPSPSLTPNNNTESDKNMSTITNTKPTSTPDGITKIDDYEGKYYIGFTHIQNKIKEKGYDLLFNFEKKQWELKNGNTVILSDIPYRNIYGRDSIEYDFYVNTILPLIK